MISRCSTTIISKSVEMMNPCDEKASVTEKQLSGVMFHKVRVTRTTGPSARELNSQQLSTILGFKMCRGKQVLRLVLHFCLGTNGRNADVLYWRGQFLAGTAVHRKSYEARLGTTVIVLEMSTLRSANNNVKEFTARSISY